MGCRSGRWRPGRRDPVLTPPGERVRVGIGGWDFAGWRGSFYPAGLPKAAELGYAAARLTSIEINGTFYRTQTPQSFAKWRDAVPADFSFAVKAARAASYSRDPEKAAASIDRFLNSGIVELGAKLGPILWQLPATRRFDAAELEGFLRLLPGAQDGVALRHVIEAKHPSFDDPAYDTLLRRYEVADCIVESETQAARRRLTTNFAYLRLQRNVAEAAEGYRSEELDGWATWLRDNMTSMSRGVHVYFISGAKQRAPDAARALLARLGQKPDGTAFHGLPDRDLRQA